VGRLMSVEHVVVIGASAGGLESLMLALCGLPRDFPAPIFVVVHVAPNRDSLLPEILTRRGSLPAVHPRDGDEIRPSMIFIAPPDHHLLIEDGHVGVKKGPKENRFRPSIDALFRSAAYTFGAGAIGVVLSGELDDGTSGLWTIKRLGGSSIVQQPEDALFASMPRSALNQVEVDYPVRAADIGPLLTMLVKQPLKEAPAVEADVLTRLEAELDIAGGDYSLDKGFTRIGELSPITCPHCHGSLVAMEEGSIVRFRCHTGHAFSAVTLSSAMLDQMSNTVQESLRALEENAMLFEMMGRQFDKAGRAELGKSLFRRALMAREQARALHEMIMEQEEFQEGIELPREGMSAAS
jgi:two-component system, chemotaxis family, protein-glutamate methylesterase/glutaminase